MFEQGRVHGNVFVEKSDGTFERRAVRIGEIDDRLVQIQAGLSSGDKIAIKGVAELQTAYASVR